jgi:predicted transcriptional regulator
MTMLSFRVEEEEAERLRQWAMRLGVDRSELLREAMHRHLIRLASEAEAENLADSPPPRGAEDLAQVADWGPAEDWSDWDDAAG